jgi:predicted deacylase
MHENIKVGDLIVKRGELKKGKIKGVDLVNSESIDIPILVMNGIKNGPTLLIMSTQHGTEIQGIEVIHKIIREEINPQQLNGSIIGIPVGNPLAFMHHQYLSWIDNLDVGRVRADNPGGNITERLANVLWEETWSKADIILNIHCNTRPDSLFYQAPNLGNPLTRDKLIQMAESFGVTTIVYDSEIKKEAPPTLSNLAARNGIPHLVIELIDGRWISEPSTSVGVRGILNIMKTFGMIDGEIEPQKGFPIVEGVNKFYGMIRPKKGGLIRFFKKPGEFIKMGEVLAEVYDLYGDVLEEINMPVDGYVWAYPCGSTLGTSGSLQVVHTGANVAYAFTHEKDWPP